MEFLIACNIMNQHSEEPFNSMNQYFPSDQCISEQNYVWIESPFKVQNRLMNFNVISLRKIR